MSQAEYTDTVSAFAPHAGEIKGAFGVIKQHEHARGGGWRKRLLTLLAILGPGLIVMVGDNDAGAFGTYAQAGQTYGTNLLWVLLLLVPVLYVNQEMVVRLGAVSGVGHARLILKRYGKFWGAFSVIDLFLLNALTIVTEFIGVSLGLDYLGLPKVWGVGAAAVVTALAAGTGDFRRFERFMMVLVAGSLAIVPIVFLVHPPAGQVAHDLLVPHLPKGGKLGEVMMLIIAIVGTTVAPWQLFFQQSYIIDKRITPRFIPYEKVDLWIGIAVVVIGAGAMIAFSAAAFAGTAGFGHFSDAEGVARGLEAHSGRIAGVLFAIGLIDASVIGAAAVSLSTAYALGDVLSLEHSLHRKVTDAPWFYLVYAGLIALAAGLVLTPGVPLGMITSAVQSLAGVLLPSATVFLLLLCNDKEVLGPWVNGRKLNAFTGLVIAALVLLSLILTASVLFPNLSEAVILWVLGGGAGVAVAVCLIASATRGRDPAPVVGAAFKEHWRMAPVDQLGRARMSGGDRLWMAAMQAYLLLAGGLVLVRIVSLVLNR